MKFRNLLAKKNLSLHRLLTWVGGIALLLFVVSAFMHPLMIWTGPRAASFFPPQVKIKSSVVESIPIILSQNKIDNAAIVKIVQGEPGPLLQVSAEISGPKRYFNPVTKTELPDYDQTQAIWLARYYSGLSDTTITNITLQTEFNTDYPSVNRLLPVYKIEFDTPDNKALFVHTETGAMGSITNNWKSALQSGFQLLHTWNWLENVETLRLIAMGIMLLSILGLVISGTGLVFLLKRRKIPQKSRRFHRYIAYAILLPLLASCLSGSLHLFWSSFEGNIDDQRLQRNLDLAQAHFNEKSNWLAPYQDISFNAMSLIEGAGGGYFYRLGIPPAQVDKVITRRQKFDGMPVEKSALYIALNNQTEAPLTDRNMSIHYARKLLKKDIQTSASASLITRFGPEYDFRNKRLPVWKIIFADAPSDILYIDPISGILVDRMTSPDLFERYVFSWAHKWDFLVPVSGRPGRDALVMLFLTSLLVLAGLGIYMRTKSTKTKNGSPNER
ncbi:hypothetical protein [Sneathiella sp. HT1-7]|uniref:hypothetical protein n=1 Tax=Sneathiella sp. HT1-7 TaxID=2887192 RepID=UPI001D152B24|nr:hypothetical protein [Sneathiella sp. HT1-7]MCC3306190.1 hypothetical protein [Sneathiella sp. HT1-7]